MWVQSVCLYSFVLPYLSLAFTVQGHELYGRRGVINVIIFHVIVLKFWLQIQIYKQKIIKLKLKLPICSIQMDNPAFLSAYICRILNTLIGHFCPKFVH